MLAVQLDAQQTAGEVLRPLALGLDRLLEVEGLALVRFRVLSFSLSFSDGSISDVRP